MYWLDFIFILLYYLLLLLLFKIISNLASRRPLKDSYAFGVSVTFGQKT